MDHDRPRWTSLRSHRPGMRPIIGLVGFCIGLGGCAGLGSTEPKPAASVDPGYIPAKPLQYTYVNDSNSRLPPELRPKATNLQLAVMHVEIPVSALPQMEKIWNHLRESAVDDTSLLRLRRNGFRIGIGNTEWWDPIQATIDSISSAVVHQPEPLRMPVGVPTSLEMDLAPREQTLFFVGNDGVLTGSTWPQSRNVLKLAYGPDLREADLIRVTLLPEVHQSFEGLRFVQTEAGSLAGVPREYGYSFDAAGVAIPIHQGEFIVLAPSEAARVCGLIGWAILSRRNQDADFVSFIFIRPEVIYARQSS